MATGNQLPAARDTAQVRRDHIEALLDEALGDTFPASDPIAISFEKGELEERVVVSSTMTSTGVTSSQNAPPMQSRVVEQKIDYWKVAPQGVAAFRHLQTYIEGCGLDQSLLELVRARASRINGCAYCLDMHIKDARRAGESEQRLYALSAWRETPFFTARERAALAWTEAITRIQGDSIDNSLHEDLRRHFDEKEIVDLTLAVIAINGWNRLAIPFRTSVGSYQPPGSAGDESVKP